jgi:hypothetical protein
VLPFKLSRVFIGPLEWNVYVAQRGIESIPLNHPFHVAFERYVERLGQPAPATPDAGRRLLL